MLWRKAGSGAIQSHIGIKYSKVNGIRFRTKKISLGQNVRRFRAAQLCGSKCRYWHCEAFIAPNLRIFQRICHQAKNWRSHRRHPGEIENRELGAGLSGKYLRCRHDESSAKVWISCFEANFPSSQNILIATWCLPTKNAFHYLPRYYRGC